MAGGDGGQSVAGRTIICLVAQDNGHKKLGVQMVLALPRQIWDKMPLTTGQRVAVTPRARPLFLGNVVHAPDASFSRAQAGAWGAIKRLMMMDMSC